MSITYLDPELKSSGNAKLIFNPKSQEDQLCPSFILVRIKAKGKAGKDKSENPLGFSRHAYAHTHTYTPPRPTQVHIRQAI